MTDREHKAEAAEHKPTENAIDARANEQRERDFRVERRLCEIDAHALIARAFGERVLIPPCPRCACKLDVEVGRRGIIDWRCPRCNWNRQIFWPSRFDFVHPPNRWKP